MLCINDQLGTGCQLRSAVQWKFSTRVTFDTEAALAALQNGSSNGCQCQSELHRGVQNVIF